MGGAVLSVALDAVLNNWVALVIAVALLFVAWRWYYRRFANRFVNRS
jgi:uncharacterized membrane protein YdjX (TVP38/TMEM64 family)